MSSKAIREVENATNVDHALDKIIVDTGTTILQDQLGHTTQSQSLLQRNRFVKVPRKQKRREHLSPNRLRIRAVQKHYTRTPPSRNKVCRDKFAIYSSSPRNLKLGLEINVSNRQIFCQQMNTCVPEKKKCNDMNANKPEEFRRKFSQMPKYIRGISQIVNKPSFHNKVRVYRLYKWKVLCI